jgi:hypothetical protein
MLTFRPARAAGRIATFAAALVTLCAFASVFLYVGTRSAGTTFYSRGSLPPEQTASWSSTRDGAGAMPLDFTSGDTFVIQNTHNMSTLLSWSVSGANSKVQIESGGTLTANNAVTLSAATTFQIDDGGTYVQDASVAMGSTILQGTEAFGANSNFVIQAAPTGTSKPSSPGYGNLTINITTGTTNVNWGGDITVVQGNFTIQSTGSNAAVEHRLTGGSNLTLNVGGNLSISGGTLVLTDGAGVPTVNLAGGYNQTGGTLTSTGSAVGLVNFSSGTPFVNFVKSGGTLDDAKIDWSIAGGKTVEFDDPFTNAAARTFNVDLGGMLLAADTITNNGTLNVNGEFRLTDGGWGTGTNFTYGADGTLGFASSGSYVVNGDAYWPAANGPANVTVLGFGITMNVARSVGGLFDYYAGVAGAGNLTLDGISRVGSGGFIASGAPNYGPVSTLNYNTGLSYSRNGEWMPGATSGAGYPVNVRVGNNTTLDLPNGSNGSAFQLGGNLIIDSGSTLGLGALTQPLNVTNSVTNNGTLTLSTALGGDIKLGGDWQDNGTFTPNGRAVFFEGGLLQALGRVGGTETFNYLVIDKTSNGVRLNTDVAVNGTAGDALQLLGGATPLDLATHTLTMSGSGGNLLVSGGARAVTSSSGAGTFTFSGSKTVTSASGGTLSLDGSVNVNLGAALALSADTTVNGALSLGAYKVTTGTNTLSIGGTGSVTRTTGYVVGTESKDFNGTGAFTFDVGTANGYSPVDANVTAGTGSLSVKPTEARHPNVTGANALARYWTLSGTGLTADLTFHYLDGDVAGDENSYEVVKYDGSFSAPAGQSVNAAANSATVNGVSSFSDWTLAEASSVFPPTPLSGTKTVCATGCDYVNLTGAAGLFAAINASTVEGDLVAQISGDLTEDGTNALNQWTESGTGGYTLSIVPADGTTKTISGNVAAGMIRLNGADRVTIDGRIPNLPGRFLLFRNTNPGGATITFLNDASNNTLRSSVIEGAMNSGTAGVVFFSTGATTGNDDNTVTDNQIRDRSDAVGVPLNLVFSGGTSASVSNSNNTVSDNELLNFGNCGVNVSGVSPGTSESWTITGNNVYQTAARVGTILGISVGAAGSNNISGNTIHDLTTSSGTLRGINLSITGSGTGNVSRNRIYSLSNSSNGTETTGIGAFANDTATVNVFNNQISLIPSGTNDQTVNGLYDQGAAGTTVNFFYNSVLVGGTGTGTARSWACLRTDSASSASTWRNNVCFNDRTGGTDNFAAGNQNPAGSFSSDYNIFVGTGGGTASDFMDYGTAATGTPVSFATWQSSTGGDANSQASNPGGNFTVANMFTSETDLHLNTSGTNPASNAGTPLDSVTNDFDDETRDPSIPDIGADEVAGASSLQFSQAAYSVGEGAGVVTITVTRTGSSVGPVSVTYSTGDGTAAAGSDYTAASGKLEWEAGDLGDKTFDVAIGDDSVYEGDENFNVTLGTAGGGAVLGTPDTATVTINENDPAPTFSVADVTQSEGDSGQTAFEFTVTKTGATAVDATVDYATQDCVTNPATGGGSCGAGVDYVTTSGPLTFAPGETEKKVTVQVCGDTDFEPDEDFFLNLSNPGGATLDDDQAEGVISNDDADTTPAVSFSIDDVTQAEGNSGTTAFTFNVTKTGAGAASVDFATQDDTAEAGSDYASNSGTLNFASGDTTKQVTVLVNGDTTPETDEDFLVVLSNPSGASVTKDTGTGTISNDEESVSAGQLIISEFRLRGPGLSEEPPADRPAGKSPAKKTSPKPRAAASPCHGGRAAVTSGKKNLHAPVQTSAPAAEPDTSPEANDEFIELYNNTDSPLLVTTTDGSQGWAVAASDGLVRFIVPNGTVIPPRAHFLSLNLLGYSLYGYPAGDGSFQPPFAIGDYVIRGDGTDCFGYEVDIPDNAGIALFRTSDPAHFNTDTRLDAVGSTSEANTLYKEGAGYPALAPEDIAKNLEHSFFRSLCSFVGGVGCSTPGVPKDTNDNAADFLFVDTKGTPTAAGQRLGAPGPENLASPVQRNGQLPLPLLDRTVPNTAPPNRVRTFDEDAAHNSTFGTLSLRRRLTNNTGADVTALRFRVVELTALPSPAGTADLRARDSDDIVVTGVVDEETCSSTGSGGAPCDVDVYGTTLEQPPAQEMGGGLNSSLGVGVISLDYPLAPGESINVQFLLGIQQTGAYRILVNVEAVTDECSCPSKPAHVRRHAAPR